MALLSDSQVADALRGLDGWAREGDVIARTVRFPDFIAGVAFIVRVGAMAEAVDHHPDIDIRYRNVKFALSTHDEGGLTQKDIDLAKQINSALTQSLV